MDNTARLIVYIAGPLNGDVEANVKKAEELSDELAKLQIGFFCPHYRGKEHFDLNIPEEYWLEYGLEVLRRSDAVILTEGWQNSSGTLKEIKEARKNNIPVFETIEGLLKFYGIKKDVIQCCKD